MCLKVFRIYPDVDYYRRGFIVFSLKPIRKRLNVKSEAIALVKKEEM
jgi:hypothetical protein